MLLRCTKKERNKEIYKIIYKIKKDKRKSLEPEFCLMWKYSSSSKYSPGKSSHLQMSESVKIKFPNFTARLDPVKFS